MYKVLLFKSTSAVCADDTTSVLGDFLSATWLPTTNFGTLSRETCHSSAFNDFILLETPGTNLSDFEATKG